MNLPSILNKINKYSLYLAVFLIPLFFLNLAQNALSLPKRFLLLIITVVSLIAWMLKQKLQGEIILKGDKKLYCIFGLILLVFILSTVFSVWIGLSFWGFPYFIADSLLSIIVLLLLTFLVINSFNEEEYVNLVKLLIGSGVLIGLFAIARLYKLNLGVNLISPLGSFNSVAIFSAALLPAVLAMLFHLKERKWLLGSATLILLVTVTLINYKAAWLVLLLGVLFSLFFSTWNSNEFNSGWIIALMGCLTLALFFYLFGYSLPFFPDRPPEVSLSLNSEYNVLRGTFAESSKNKILGSGPATFTLGYSQHHSPLINQTAFWGTRFQKGASTFWDWFITKGILGGLTLVVLWGYLMVKGVKEMLDLKSDNWSIKLGIFSTAVALIGAQLLHSFGFSLMFLFWLSVAVMIGLSSEKKKVKLNQKGASSLYLSLAIVLMISAGLGMILLQGVRYTAAVNHNQGIKLYRNENIEKAIDKVTNATKLTSTPLSTPIDLYYRDLAQIYLSQANKVAQDENLINPGLVNTSVANGVESINRATEIAPFNPANWSVRGFFFKNLIGVEGAKDLAINSYKEAASLEPSSPFAYSEMGRIYILSVQNSDSKSQEELDLAIDNLNKAIDLKPNYAPAHYLLAVAYDQKGNIEDAISRLEKAEIAAGGDMGIGFQLGLLYYRQGKIEKARDKFLSVVDRNPKYSNARYMLGLAYDKLGKREKAKGEFKKIAELNPDNQRLEKIISNLDQGRSALEGLGTTTTPLEDKPQEIK